ncbi:PilZ domain-containing protein [Rubrivivax gelatinosus]|uniref:Acetyltransferase (GNAT) family protein n=1 Tax=Rubrivivax gelatinosus TaxID=28068 RepID=A0A4R2MR12_RUBGE|nr:PilZ domain-containing protein [Rubrivivax gelatinosus]MBK1686141.1 hypothetical protein [Rubrivivax gelatinosus]TCP05636.1 acetyltransferase (GNAT) family protein [Rubrivivax gelatinosus]
MSTRLRKNLHAGLRSAMGMLPQTTRHAIFRRMVDCDPAPDDRLQVRIVDARQDLEACFGLLHDAYVASGFMKPHPSGLRVTPYHALPTTTTIAAFWDGEVVGTMSMIREGVFGFPLQSVFDLSAVRAQPGRVAEISALAVHRKFRASGGKILFPLMKFMYEYCSQYFDTRHLVIAVNPNKIELYESLLFFRRLQAATVENYDFANGAPAVGATLDLHQAPETFRAAYTGREGRKDLHHYFVEQRLPNLKLPERRYFTTNDPVMTPALLDYFFTQRTDCFAQLDPRRLGLLHSIYDSPEYAAVLPPLPYGHQAGSAALRRHPRYSIKCPAVLTLEDRPQALEVVELSQQGFQAHGANDLAMGARGWMKVQLGEGVESTVLAEVVRRVPTAVGHFHGFRVEAPDPAWLRCVRLLETGTTHADLAAERPAGSLPSERRAA